MLKIQEIKTENKLNKEEDLYTRRDIRIPYKGQTISEAEPTEEEKKKYKLEMQKMYIRRFKRAVNPNNTNAVSDGEAKYYLKMNGWCLELAV